MGGRSEETYGNYVDEHGNTQGRVEEIGGGLCPTMDCERVLGKSTSMIYSNNNDIRKDIIPDFTMTTYSCHVFLKPKHFLDYKLFRKLPTRLRRFIKKNSFS